MTERPCASGPLSNLRRSGSAALTNHSTICEWQVNTNSSQVSDKSMTEPAVLMSKGGSKLTRASSTIASTRSDRWPNSRISRNHEAKNSCSRLPRLRCRAVPDVDLGTVQRGVFTLVHAFGGVHEEPQSLVDHVRLPFILELAQEPIL